MRRRRAARPRKSHGALWSIIYIDLMTQIMAFFVIVWTIEHGAKATATATKFHTQPRTHDEMAPGGSER